MAMFRKLKDLDSTFAWSFLGAVITLIFGGIGIYAGFFYERRPAIDIEILSNTTVLDVHQRIGDLSIFYDGVDITKHRKVLRILLIRFVNSGNADILINNFDSNDLPGYKLNYAQFAQRPEIVQASNSYIRHNIQLTTQASSVVRFAPIILESSEFFDIKMLVLATENRVPTISPIGKVAGILHMNIVPSYLNERKESLLVAAFSGHAVVQATRIFGYTALIVVLLAALIAVVIGLNRLRAKLVSRIAVRKYIASSGVATDEDTKTIFRIFYRYGATGIAIAKELLADEGLRRKAFEGKITGDLGWLPWLVALRKEEAHWTSFGSVGRKFANELIRSGLLLRDSNGYRPNVEVGAKIADFAAYLKRTGKLPAEVTVEVYLDNPFVPDDIARLGRRLTDEKISKGAGKGS